MALNWDIGNIKDRHALHNTGDDAFPEGSPEDKQGDMEWAITNALIWDTISIGMSSITKANWMKFAARVIAMEMVNGTSLHKAGEPFYITPEMVHRRIGLSTNASTLTDAKFERKLAQHVIDKAHRKVRKFEKSIATQEVEA